MHIRTNIEIGFVHVAVLAVCPLMLIMTNASQALYFVCATAVCYLISALICTMFNRYLGRSTKIFITALLSTFLVTIFDYAIENYSFLGFTDVPENSFFAVITTIILSTDIVYIETKALVRNFFVKLLRVLLSFAVITMIFAIVNEFLGYGTVFGNKLFSFKGYEFFKTITFQLLWLGLIGFIAELIYRAISKRINDKQIAYQKFVKKIRNEKVFQYDNLRRQKLLISEIETNKIDGDKIEEIKEKESENEPVGVEDITGELSSEETKSEDRSKKKKNKKLKFSKETKVEKLYDRQSKEDK